MDKFYKYFAEQNKSLPYSPVAIDMRMCFILEGVECGVRGHGLLGMGGHSQGDDNFYFILCGGYTGVI